MILTKWQGMRLSEEMAKKPDESEISVFRTFIEKIVTLQKQLDSRYQGDGFLIDQLLSSIGISEIQDSVKDIIPLKSSNYICRIANRLKYKSQSSGATSVAMLN